MPTLLANHMPALAVAIVAGLFALFVFTLFYVEHRINHQVKHGNRLSPPADRHTS